MWNATFDTVHHHTFLDRLKYWGGVSGSALEWLTSYLSEWYFSLAASESSSFYLSYCVPQGSLCVEYKIDDKATFSVNPFTSNKISSKQSYWDFDTYVPTSIVCMLPVPPSCCPRCKHLLWRRVPECVQLLQRHPGCGSLRDLVPVGAGCGSWLDPLASQLGGLQQKKVKIYLNNMARKKSHFDFMVKTQLCNCHNQC